MFGMPIAFRSFLDHLRFTERQEADRLPPAPRVRRIDTTSMPVDLKHPPRMRTPAEMVELQILTAHVTDVDGGYGVAKFQIDKWRARLRTGKVPADLLAQLTDPADLGGSSFALALLERYSEAPYHRIGSRRLGSIRNHPMGLRTSHGGPGGNEGGGWALDCDNTEKLKPALVEIGRASLDDAVDEMLGLGAPRVVLVGHRAWEDDRREDPGAIVWREVVRPVVDARAAAGFPVVIGFRTKAGSGLPVPRSWDDRALFDERGRPIAA